MIKGDDYTTGCLPDYNYFKKYYKLIATDLSKQKLDADSKAMQQIKINLLYCFWIIKTRKRYTNTFHY